MLLILAFLLVTGGMSGYEWMAANYQDNWDGFGQAILQMLIAIGLVMKINFARIALIIYSPYAAIVFFLFTVAVSLFVYTFDPTEFPWKTVGVGTIVVSIWVWVFIYMRSNEALGVFNEDKAPKESI